MTTTVERRIAHYRVEEQLGSGGMGTVYRATDEKLGRRVALKFLRQVDNPELRQRFLREARAASALDHPNVCTIFTVDETDAGELFIAMAYYEGQTLEQLLANERLAPKRAHDIAVQIGRGLAAAHAELIVHRDIKPANIMVTRGDAVKILDFGLAKLVRDARPSSPGAAIGTLAYMSPEQLRGDPVDARTDIWALGIVLFEMLTGRLPFGGDRAESLMQSILHDRPLSLADLSPSSRLPLIDQILRRALAKNPALRYEHVEQMVDDLLAAQPECDSGALTWRRRVQPRKRSLAVLPFADMSPARDQDYLCEGIAEEILHALARIPELYVASRTSAFRFKQEQADIREIGARLNVDTILEGSVRRAGDRVRIAVQLVNVDDGYRLWHERFDRDMTDIFAIEDEIAERIATVLQVTLADDALRPGAAAAGDAEAYSLYLQGRQYFRQHRRKAFELALQLFSRAIEIDAGYARAFAGIANCHSFLHLYFGRGAEAIAEAARASRRALELGPALAETHAARGLALFLTGEHDEAERELARAAEIDRMLYDAHYIRGRLSFSRGRVEEAAAHFAGACAVASEAYDSWYLLGMCYRRLGESAKARTCDRDCLEAVNRQVRHHPDDTRAWTMGAAVLVTVGEPDRAEQWVTRALAIDADEPIIQYNAACVYVALGRHEEALACLEQSIGHGALLRSWLMNDPDLDPLRESDRFKKLLA